MYANHGALVKHQHLMEGINSRLDGLQAALLSAKLKHLPQWTAARQRVARLYEAALAGIPQVSIPRTREGSTHVYHLYVIACERRDELKAWLGDQGIETAVHYPTALPLLAAYRHLGLGAGDFPRAARNQQAILSLPMYAEMSDDMVSHVAQKVRAFYG